MSYAEYLEATKGATDEDAGDEFDEDHIELVIVIVIDTSFIVRL